MMSNKEELLQLHYGGVDVDSSGYHFCSGKKCINIMYNSRNLISVAKQNKKNRIHKGIKYEKMKEGECVQTSFIVRRVWSFQEV